MKRADREADPSRWKSGRWNVPNLSCEKARFARSFE